MRNLGVVVFVALGACHFPQFGDGWGSGGGGGGDTGAPDQPFGPQPDFGPLVTQPVAPPPISGGTLAILAGTQIAVAADPDRDRVYVVDLAAQTKLADIALAAGDEPGRVLEDAHQRVHVVLRGAGALVTLDPAAWTIAARRSVCAAPRGVAYDAGADVVHVACASGELVTLPAAGGAATRTLVLDRDLRDVVVYNGGLAISRFRSAELLIVDAAGTITQRTSPLGFTSPSTQRTFLPDGAWRLQAGADGDLYMLHQRGTTGTVHQGQHGGYGGADPCGDPIVHATVTRWTSGLVPSSGPVIASAIVPVDFALATTSDEVSIVSPANALVFGASVVTSYHTTGGNDCDGVARWFSGEAGVAPAMSEPIAVAYTAADALIVQSREPARLIVLAPTQQPTMIELSPASRADTGHAVFHANAGAGIACASCHLEGGDDAHVWTFDALGGRRTQSLRGNVFGTEPFHWDGDEADFAHLVGDVFVGRMAGPALTPLQLAAAQGWIAAIPLVAKAPGDAAAIARGQALFQGGAGCVACHTGPKLTNNATLNVGTGAPFQVPSLVGVAERAPFLHDGRAVTLADRFDPAIGGGDRHGHTSQLSPTDIADLIAYLGSL